MKRTPKTPPKAKTPSLLNETTFTAVTEAEYEAETAALGDRAVRMTSSRQSEMLCDIRIGPDGDPRAWMEAILVRPMADVVRLELRSSLSVKADPAVKLILPAELAQYLPALIGEVVSRAKEGGLLEARDEYMHTARHALRLAR